MQNSLDQLVAWSSTNKHANQPFQNKERRWSWDVLPKTIYKHVLSVSLLSNGFFSLNCSEFLSLLTYWPPMGQFLSITLLIKLQLGCTFSNSWEELVCFQSYSCTVTSPLSEQSSNGLHLYGTQRLPKLRQTKLRQSRAELLILYFPPSQVHPVCTCLAPVKKVETFQNILQQNVLQIAECTIYWHFLETQHSHHDSDTHLSIQDLN